MGANPYPITRSTKHVLKNILKSVEPFQRNYVN